MSIVVNNGPFGLTIQNEHIVYENEIRCIVKESEFNLSYNPTLVTGSYENGLLYDFAQGIKYSPTFDYTSVTSSVSFSTISGSAGGGTRVIDDSGLPSASLANSIGFDFNFYGTIYNSCNVINQGNIQFTTALFDNSPPVSLEHIIFPLYVSSINAAYFNPDHGVWTKLTGTAGSRIFTVEWKFNDDFFGDNNFQAKLYEGTNVIELIYGNTSTPIGSMDYNIGIQNTSLQKNIYGDANTISIPPAGTKIVYTPTSTTYITGSFDFQPYATTIGLYNDDNDLLMVAKLGKPIGISPNTDMTFIVKYDI